jgi:restriction system protein
MKMCGECNKFYDGDNCLACEALKKRPHLKHVVSFDSLTGEAFEQYCAFLLASYSYNNIKVTKGSGDYGVDITCSKDGVTYAIQCKRYSSNVGSTAVQEVYTGKGIYKRDIAIIITNQYFSNQAKEAASLLGVKLWDRDHLMGMEVQRAKAQLTEKEKRDVQQAEYEQQLEEFRSGMLQTLKEASDKIREYLREHSKVFSGLIELNVDDIKSPYFIINTDSTKSAKKAMKLQQLITQTFGFGQCHFIFQALDKKTIKIYMRFNDI